MNPRLPLILILLCGVIAAIVWLLWQNNHAFDLTALMAANIIMLALSLAAWAMLRKSVAERPQAFVRGVYGATMLRLFVCLIGIMTYALMIRAHLHKPTLFVMFGIYMAYTIIETAAFSRTAKKVG
jgi:ABC-type transport system involved in multi-copper enzyme maturation permease subunit